MYFGAMVLLRLKYVNYRYYILSICILGIMYKTYLHLGRALSAYIVILYIAIRVLGFPGIYG